MCAFHLHLLLLLLSAHHLNSQECSAPEKRRPLVTHLLHTVLQAAANSSVEPDPSVHLALRLARTHNLGVEARSLQRLKEAAVRKVQEGDLFPIGQVALYSLALTASCEDPARVKVGDEIINLVQILQTKIIFELGSLVKTGRLLTTYYQLSLAILAQCKQNISIPTRGITELTSAVLRDHLTIGGSFSVDTGAVTSLALICLSRSEHQRWKVNQRREMRVATRMLKTQILLRHEADGTIGNIYSTGLAFQALDAYMRDVLPDFWDCQRSIDRLLHAVETGTITGYFLAAQALPALEGRAYLDVDQLACSADVDNLMDTSCDITSPNPSHHCQIEVTYIILDAVNYTFMERIRVRVNKGSTMLVVMEMAASSNPAKFSFKVIRSSLGIFVLAINGLTGNLHSRTYWQFLNGAIPFNMGVDTFKPNDKDLIIARYTSF